MFSTEETLTQNNESKPQMTTEIKESKILGVGRDDKSFQLFVEMKVPPT